MTRQMIHNEKGLTVTGAGCHSLLVGHEPANHKVDFPLPEHSTQQSSTALQYSMLPADRRQKNHSLTIAWWTNLSGQRTCVVGEEGVVLYHPALNSE